jgi:glycosyltransferase involved in cell wall biosynthesis
MKMYFPLLYWSHKILRTQVFHYVIGGTLASEVQAHPKWKKYISAFEGNWVESRLVVEKLRAQGVNNACYVPNFKQLSPLREEELSPVHTPMRFCTFSRVMKEKGISDAINALATVNREETVATLTVYGPVAKEYEEEFGALCKRYASFCTYGGVIDAEKSVSVLKNYDLLLFPTYWYGEGMPGTMIDAFCAGLPIVARWWPYCDEMITHLQTGFVYPFDRPEQLEQWVRYALSHPQEVYAMKKACLAAGASYTQACVLPQILALLQEKK